MEEYSIETAGDLIRFCRQCTDRDEAHKFMDWYVKLMGYKIATRNVMWVTGEFNKAEGRRIAKTFGVRYAPMEGWL